MKSSNSQGDLDHEVILNSLNHGIITFSRKGEATFINSVALNALGYDAEDIIGYPVHLTIHHSKPDGAIYYPGKCPIVKIVKSGISLEGIAEVFWKKDGTELLVEVYGRPIYKEEKIIGATISFKERFKKSLESSEINFGHSSVPIDFTYKVGVETYEFHIRPFPDHYSAIIYGYNITKWIKGDTTQNEGYAIDRLVN
jgi:PAS domain S-box-containing protein